MPLDDQERALQQAQMQWISRLSLALEQNCFRLFYHPIVPITDSLALLRHLQHCEVLLRLEDETGQLMSSIAFVLEVEHYHQRHLIDRCLIATLFTQLAQQPHLWQQPRLFMVNLSDASLNDKQFISFVQQQFASSGIPPQTICFQITETVAISNLAQAAALMRLLKKTGCSFALNEFGSGTSSFADLKTLQVDYLKIDGAFVREVSSNPIAAATVHSIAQVAKARGIQTIAEEVASEQIFAKVRQLQVDFAQGFLISPPLPWTGEWY